MIQTMSDILVVGPEGELDTFQGRLLLKKIGGLIEFEWNKIVIDLNRVDHIDYRLFGALSILAAAATSSLSLGGIKLANISPYNRKILRVTGLDGFFETYESVAEAVLSFHDPLTEAGLMQ